MPRHRWVEWGGARWQVGELARLHGLGPSTLAKRLSRGVPVGEALGPVLPRPLVCARARAFSGMRRR